MIMCCYWLNNWQILCILATFRDFSPYANIKNHFNLVKLNFIWKDFQLPIDWWKNQVNRLSGSKVMIIWSFTINSSTLDFELGLRRKLQMIITFERLDRFTWFWYRSRGKKMYFQMKISFTRLKWFLMLAWGEKCKQIRAHL